MEVKNFRFKDKDGKVLYEFPITGVAPDITVTASVDNNVGVPSVTVTKTGENDRPTYNLDFKNLKGDTGPQGVQGIQGIQGPAVPIDTVLSTTSNNAIANSTVTTDFNAKLQNKFDAFGNNYSGNLDALVSNGCYFISKTTGISGTLPAEFNYFTLLVFRSNYTDTNSCVQLAVNATGKAIASRMYINNAWTSWGIYNSAN